MRLNIKLSGLLVAGLLSTGCGGTLPEEAVPEQHLSQTEQEAIPTCPTGYTRGSYWDCAQTCGAGWGNFLVYYCSNGSDWYEVGTGPVRCGACY
jgi:hypothetical protein